MKNVFLQILCFSFILTLSTSAVAQSQDEVQKIKKQVTKANESQSVSPTLPPPPPPPPVEICDMFSPVEEMPRFGACEDQNLNKKDLEDCAKQTMLEYIYDNLVYPEQAKQKRIEGMAVVRFIVDKDGSMIDLKLVRDLGEGCGQAALDVVKKMQENYKWIPGKQRDRVVKVQYNLPIKFKL